MHVVKASTNGIQKIIPGKNTRNIHQTVITLVTVKHLSSQDMSVTVSTSGNVNSLFGHLELLTDTDNMINATNDSIHAMIYSAVSMNETWDIGATIITAFEAGGLSLALIIFLVWVIRIVLMTRRKRQSHE